MPWVVGWPWVSLSWPLLDVLSGLQAFVEVLDPGQVPARDAIDLVRVLDRIGRVAEAAKAAAAGRVAESSLWSKAGHRSPAHWVARETGIGVGEAIKLLETAEVVAAAPVVQEALATGVVSPRQARAAARAEKAQPGEGARLVAKARSVSVTELETDAARIVAAGVDASRGGRRPLRHRRARRMFHGRRCRRDGVRVGCSIRSHPGSSLSSRPAGPGLRRGPHGVIASRRRPTPPMRSLPSPTPPVRRSHGRRGDVRRAAAPSVVEDWSFTKMIVRVDLTALDRGAGRSG